MIIWSLQTLRLRLQHWESLTFNFRKPCFWLHLTVFHSPSAFSRSSGQRICSGRFKETDRMSLTRLEPVSELPTVDTCPFIHIYFCSSWNQPFLRSQQATENTLCNHVLGANGALSALRTAWRCSRLEMKNEGLKMVVMYDLSSLRELVCLGGVKS